MANSFLNLRIKQKPLSFSMTSEEAQLSKARNHPAFAIIFKDQKQYFSNPRSSCLLFLKLLSRVLGFMIFPFREGKSFPQDLPQSSLASEVSGFSWHNTVGLLHPHQSFLPHFPSRKSWISLSQLLSAVESLQSMDPKFPYCPVTA